MGLRQALCVVFAFWVAAAVASPAQTFTTLASFKGPNGTNPQAAPVQGTDGNLYGTTSEGGSSANCSGGCGTVFRITTAGTLRKLHSFDSTDGANTWAGLVLGTDGNFYGTMTNGGTRGGGTVFQITPDGTLTTLHNFGWTDGSEPFAGLVLATDGDFYGTTFYGGAGGSYCGGCGTVFKITSGGTFTTLYNFCPQTSPTLCPDGEHPAAPLVQATDGDFYGTTFGYSAFNDSTIFKITPSGTLRVLNSFGGVYRAGLIQAPDGDFYDATYYGGSFDFGGHGTIIKITPGGTLRVVRGFCYQSGCPHGSNPIGGLVLATDGNFYGTTLRGGTSGDGTVFKITPGGTLTTLYNFCSQSGCADGANSYAGLVQGTDGNFYGTTENGGAKGTGTVFSLSMGLGPFVAFVRDSGKVGWKAEILGQGFTGTTSVSFNGTAADFTVKRDTYLDARVPAGATTGQVTVTTPGGALNSNVAFRVRPQIVSFTPTSGPVGTQVTVTGVSLTQTTDVEFCGVPASFTVDSDTQVTLTVPAGAKTDEIAITTAGGKVWSAEDFTVTQ